MKCNLLIWLVGILLLAISGPSMGQQLEKQLISSGGVSTGGSYTIGEVVLGGDLEVLAGFQQPSFLGEANNPLGTKDISFELAVFPNPTTDQITIRGDGFTPATYEVKLFDALGRTLKVPIEKGDQELSMDLKSLSEGQYFLLLQDLTREQMAKLKILKTR